MPSVLITIPRATVLIAQSKYLPLLPRNIINQLYTYYCNIEPKWFLTSRDKVVFHFISFHPAPPFPSYSCNVQTIARRPCSHSILPPAVAFFFFFFFHSPLSARQNGAHNIADDPVLLTTQGGRKKLQRLEHVDIRVHLRGGRAAKKRREGLGGGWGGVPA